MNATEVRVLEECARRGHEQVVFFNYPEFGLKAIVSIHSTVLGPALGGCRMRFYESESEAIDDVMRLAEGMTYKSAIAGMDLGGGKAGIIADPALSEGRKELFVQFGHCLNNLNGRYITAEDMGTSVDDMLWVRQVSKFVTGGPPAQGGSGDPSPWTALGTFKAIQAACQFRYGSMDLTGKTVSVQGIGHVGRYLAEHLIGAGASLVVSDVNEQAVEKAVAELGVRAVPTGTIYDEQVDIYAPCAVGQTVNPETIGRLKCDIIAGPANNQLSDNSMYTLIEERGMLYCPDFVINSGGVISVGAELRPGGWQESWVTEKVQAIGDTTLRVLEESKQRGRFPELVALELANERISEAAARRRR
jgi:leucine dehydrogenase